MTNIKYELTADDLIVEYMAFKLKNGYEPSFSSVEFMQFLDYFEKKMPVSDVLYSGKELFQRFYERKLKRHWTRCGNINRDERVPDPHMEFVYDEVLHDYVLAANYEFCAYDESIINTYHMENRTSVKKNIQRIIGDYLKDIPKRSISERETPNEKEILAGKYIAAEIVRQVWLHGIDKEIEIHRWPSQCKDMNEFLFDTDLAEIIHLPSRKKELIELYKELSKRIAYLYHRDPQLKIRSIDSYYLARSNFELLIKGYETLLCGFRSVFGPYQKSLNIDLEDFTFQESHEIDGVYDWDDDIPVKTTTNKIENEQVKVLVKNFDKN